MFLRQSTSQVIRFGPFLDITDGVSEETALTLAQADMRLSKDGGAFAQKNAAGNATHDSDGWYSTTLDATDTNTVGELILNVHQPANTLPVWMRFYVVEEAVYDAFYAASAAGIPSIPANWITATGIATNAITAAKIAASAITSSQAPNLDAAISTRATPAQVNNEVLDVLNVDTFAEPGQATPAATASLVTKIGYLYKFLRNRKTATSSQINIYNDDATTVDQKRTISDNGTTYDEGEVTTGP